MLVHWNNLVCVCVCKKKNINIKDVIDHYEGLLENTRTAQPLHLNRLTPAVCITLEHLTSPQLITCAQHLVSTPTAVTLKPVIKLTCSVAKFLVL